MTNLLGVQYGDRVVEDPTWDTEADVLASYHGSGYITEGSQATGVLVRRGDDGQWVPVH